MTLYIDIHILQTVPPSNLNRDEGGSPKTATYGGVRRARVSSQAWKRATRRDFADALDAGDLGVRTKRLVELLVERIQARTEVDEAAAAQRATDVLKAAKLEVKPPRKDEAGLPLTEYLVFVSNALSLDRLKKAGIVALAGLFLFWRITHLIRRITRRHRK